MYADLSGKTALVTGSGKRAGIGYAIASKLAKSGANVILTDVVNNDDANNPLLTCSRDNMAALATDLACEFSVKAAFIFSRRPIPKDTQIQAEGVSSG